MLMASPRAKGLFHRAIGQSGGVFEPVQIAPQYLLANAERDGKAYVSSLRADSIAALRKRPAADLLGGTAGSVSHPVIEPYVLPDRTLRRLRFRLIQQRADSRRLQRGRSPCARRCRARESGDVRGRYRTQLRLPAATPHGCVPARDRCTGTAGSTRSGARPALRLGHVDVGAIAIASRAARTSTTSCRDRRSPRVPSTMAGERATSPSCGTCSITWIRKPGLGPRRIVNWRN